MLTFVDLFCGGGFGARGAVRAGARPLLGVDAWSLATETYSANFPEAAVLTARIQDLNPAAIAKQYKPHILLTSPECTSHSIARGAKAGSESSRATAIGILPWVRAMKTPWVIVENVNRMKQWSRHGYLVERMTAMGYRVDDIYLNAADFGAPQARKRLFLIANNQGHIVTREDLMNSHNRQPRAAESIIDWSNAYPATPLYSPRRAKGTIERAERAIRELGKNKPFLIVYYGSDYAGGWQRIDSPLRTVTTLDRFGLVTWRGATPYLRMLQPSELVRAMGAGAMHQLPFGSRREKIKLCGNGVCSPVLEVIVRRIGQLAERSAA